MAGSAFVGGVKGVKSDISSVRGETNGSGVGGSDNSSIGEGRKGADAMGTLSDPMYTRIDTEVVHKPMNGTANGGTTGYGSGYGRTFGRK